jgi:hypothetical protein
LPLLPCIAAEDINQVLTETVTSIIKAKGTYIEDCLNKRKRHGLRAQHAAAVTKREREILLADTAATNTTPIWMVKSMKDHGGGVSSYTFSTTM